MDPEEPGQAGAPGPARTPQQLRSYRWFGEEPAAGAGSARAGSNSAGRNWAGLRALSHRSRMHQLGFGTPDHLGKPFIAILNTWAEINPCHMHLRERAEQVRRGVWQAGGFPLEFGVATLSETFQKPTPMLYRNLLAMETEELLRSYPVDGAVLMGGCDKTTPALLMGAASAGLPAIFVPAGLRAGRADAARQLPRRPARQRHRPVEVLGRLPGRGDRRLRAGRARGRDRPLARALHDDGHRLDHDLGGRGARHDPARRRLHPRGRLGALPDGLGQRPPDRGDGLGEPHSRPDPHPRGLRGRGRDRPRARRLDQRADPPHRDGRALRRAL